MNYPICQKCKKRPATVHIQKIINGHKTSMELCEECAKENTNLFDHFASSFLDPDAMFNSMLGFGNTRELVSTCPTCGMSDRDFIDNGYLGCPDCYKAFSAYVDNMIDRVQPAKSHIGRKKGAKLADTLDKNVEQDMSEVDKLKLELKVAIKDEDYLKAAKLRDQIKAIDNKETK